MTVQHQDHYDWSVAKFTDKERLFVLFYISDGNRNKTKAAIEAGYASAHANKSGHNVSIRPHVKAAIDWYLERVQEKALVSAERIIEELAHIAFVDPREAFKGSNHIDVDKLPEHVARALGNVNVRYLENGDVVHTLDFNSKIKALELLGKKFKMFTDKVEISDRPLVVIKDLSGRKKSEKSE